MVRVAQKQDVVAFTIIYRRCALGESRHNNIRLHLEYVFGVKLLVSRAKILSVAAFNEQVTKGRPPDFPPLCCLPKLFISPRCALAEK